MRPGERAFYFHIGTEPYVLKDSFYMTQEKFDSLSTEELEAMKMQRYTNWYNAVNVNLQNPPAIEESPTIVPMYDWTPGQEPSQELIDELTGNNASVQSTTIISDITPV